MTWWLRRYLELSLPTFSIANGVMLAYPNFAYNLNSTSYVSANGAFTTGAATSLYIDICNNNPISTPPYYRINQISFGTTPDAFDADRYSGFVSPITGPKTQRNVRYIWYDAARFVSTNNATGSPPSPTGCSFGAFGSNPMSFQFWISVETSVKTSQWWVGMAAAMVPVSGDSFPCFLKEATGRFCDDEYSGTLELVTSRNAVVGRYLSFPTTTKFIDVGSGYGTPVGFADWWTDSATGIAYPDGPPNYGPEPYIFVPCFDYVGLAGNVEGGNATFNWRTCKP